MGNKYAKEKALEQLGKASKTDRRGIEKGKEGSTAEFASSRAFFSNLEDGSFDKEAKKRKKAAKAAKHGSGGSNLKL